MRILYYEMRKNFLKPSIIICLIIFSFINIYKINEGYKNFMYLNYPKVAGDIFLEGYKKVYYEKVKGEITKEKIDFIMNYYKEMIKLLDDPGFNKEYDESKYTGYIFGDKNLFKDGIISDMEYNYMYGSNISKIVEKSRENVILYSKLGNDYEVNKNKKIINSYENRSLTELSLTWGIEYYLRYDFSSLLIILLMILGLSSVFCNENETQMLQLIATSVNKRKTVMMKFFASFGYIVFLCSYFYLLDLLAIYIITGTDTFSNPLYSLSFFQFTPLNMSVASFLVLDFMMKIFVMLFLAGIVLLLSSYLKQTVIVFVLSVTLVSGLILLNDYQSTVLNPIALVTNYTMVNKFESINVFGLCLLKHQVCIGITGIWCFILLVIMRKRAVRWC